MKSICYVIPYFGELPYYFQFWLNSCGKNPTVNWLVLTNDKTEFNYPKNVKVVYCEFEDFKKKIQSHFDFEIKMDSYWEISFFKPAYGEVFSDYLKEYDYWGYCDADLLWGNIRKFITDDVLEKYERIGFQGHSTLYKNDSVVNARYKTIVPGEANYIDIFSGRIKYSFDENGMDKIYEYLNIPYYKEITFAHLSMRKYSFWVSFLDKNEDYKNKRQVFLWDNGTLIRKYVYKNKMHDEEYMYVHFFTRPMKFVMSETNNSDRLIIYPDVVKNYDEPVTVKFIKKYGKCSMISFYIKMIYFNRKKLSLKKIIKRLKIIYFE